MTHSLSRAGAFPPGCCLVEVKSMISNGKRAKKLESYFGAIWARIDGQFVSWKSTKILNRWI